MGSPTKEDALRDYSLFDEPTVELSDSNELSHKRTVQDGEKQDLYFQQEEMQGFPKRSLTPMTDRSRKIFAHKPGRVCSQEKMGKRRGKEKRVSRSQEEVCKKT